LLSQEARVEVDMPAPQTLRVVLVELLLLLRVVFFCLTTAELLEEVLGLPVVMDLMGINL
jgi:hypothetical protein